MRETSNILGQGMFLGIRALRQTLTYNLRKKGSTGEDFPFFALETLKNLISNEKFYVKDDHNQGISSAN